MASRGGRGAYYRNKYGRGRGRGNYDGEIAPRKVQRTHQLAKTFPELHNVLTQLDNKPYGAYRDLEGCAWNNEQIGYTLFVGRAQSDPFAPPTRCRITLPPATTGMPATLYNNRVRRTAAADYLLRQLFQTCKAIKADQSLSNNAGGWSGPKGGDIQVMEPAQHVIEQSAVQLDHNGNCQVQLTINLPARGRSILGHHAWRIFNESLTHILSKSVLYSSLTPSDINAHVDSVEDQAWLQSQLDGAGLIAFVRNGAILPRRSGADDRPLQEPSLVPFKAPPSLSVSFQLPNSRTTISGLGVKKGITLICGGGFHGKTTLLQALQLGVYWKIPGDGREFCVTAPSATKIRAEDGRSVQSVDISPFIRNLPFGKDTTDFSTGDASGSTSQASNIVEAIEAGATALLMDEDTCATNFMIRDEKMMQLVEPAKEPIIPFVRLVRPLLGRTGISTVLVIGGAGDYFDVADHVLLMDCYTCIDATDRAKDIVSQHSNHQGGEEACLVGTSRRTRFMSTCKLYPSGKVKVNPNGLISYGECQLVLSAMEQIVCDSQTNAIAAALQVLASSDASEKQVSVVDSVRALDLLIEETGLDALSPGTYNGMFMRPRVAEICGAINRLRVDFITQQLA